MTVSAYDQIADIPIGEKNDRGEWVNKRELIPGRTEEAIGLKKHSDLEYSSTWPYGSMITNVVLSVATIEIFFSAMFRSIGISMPGLSAFVVAQAKHDS